MYRRAGEIGLGMVGPTNTGLEEISEIIFNQEYKKDSLLNLLSDNNIEGTKDVFTFSIFRDPYDRFVDAFQDLVGTHRENNFTVFNDFNPALFRRWVENIWLPCFTGEKIVDVEDQGMVDYCTKNLKKDILGSFNPNAYFLYCQSKDLDFSHINMFIDYEMIEEGLMDVQDIISQAHSDAGIDFSISFCEAPEFKDAIKKNVIRDLLARKHDVFWDNNTRKIFNDLNSIDIKFFKIFKSFEDLAKRERRSWKGVYNKNFPTSTPENIDQEELSKRQFIKYNRELPNVQEYTNAQLSTIFKSLSEVDKIKILDYGSGVGCLYKVITREQNLSKVKFDMTCVETEGLASVANRHKWVHPMGTESDIKFISDINDVKDEKFDIFWAKGAIMFIPQNFSPSEFIDRIIKISSEWVVFDHIPLTDGKGFFTQYNWSTFTKKWFTEYLSTGCFHQEPKFQEINYKDFLWSVSYYFYNLESLVEKMADSGFYLVFHSNSGDIWGENFDKEGSAEIDEITLGTLLFKRI